MDESGSPDNDIHPRGGEIQPGWRGRLRRDNPKREICLREICLIFQIQPRSVMTPDTYFYCDTLIGLLTREACNNRRRVIQGSARGRAAAVRRCSHYNFKSVLPGEAREQTSIGKKSAVRFETRDTFMSEGCYKRCGDGTWNEGPR